MIIKMAMTIEEQKKREEILKRLESTLRKKRARLQEMEKRVRELYKERTGEEPKYVGVL
jgi:ElaB/YqjD/DUF883 family membrane-anchored ribosome-binding protein